MARLRTDCSVTLVQQVGSDEMIARAARRSSKNSQKTDGVKPLIGALIKGRHGSPFEHGSLTIEVECPIFVSREWMRHRIGWSYSELSGRYSEIDQFFWAPHFGRGIVNVGKAIRPQLADGTWEQSTVMAACLREAYSSASAAYQKMLEAGIAKEVARAVLPVATFTNFWATANPRSIMHFLSLRVQSEDATYPTYPQAEIEECATQLENIFAEYWPITHDAFVKHGRVAP